MDKKMIIAVFLVALIALGAFLFLQQKAPSEIKSPEDVSAVHLLMDPKSLPSLEEVINGTGDNYTRERALITYADIALRSGNGTHAMEFLKGVVYNEQNDEVLSSAYANYYWLKDEMGIAPNATMNVSVSGNLKTGNNITVLLTVYSPRPTTDLAKVSCGAVDIEDHDVTTGGSPGTGVIYNDSISGEGVFAHAWVLAPDMVKANITQIPIVVPFTVYLREDGKTIVKCRTQARYDRLDYDLLEEDIYLDISASGGNYTITAK